MIVSTKSKRNNQDLSRRKTCSILHDKAHKWEYCGGGKENKVTETRKRALW